MEEEEEEETRSPTKKMWGKLIFFLFLRREKEKAGGEFRKMLRLKNVRATFRGKFSFLSCHIDGFKKQYFFTCLCFNTQDFSALRLPKTRDNGQ